MKNTTEQNEELERINAEIFSHMANPRNYGEMNENDGVGKCLNELTQEFLMVFIKSYVSGFDPKTKIFIFFFKFFKI